MKEAGFKRVGERRGIGKGGREKRDWKGWVREARLERVGERSEIGNGG